MRTWEAKGQVRLCRQCLRHAAVVLLNVDVLLGQEVLLKIECLYLIL
jgi:hypothetical protein